MIKDVIADHFVGNPEAGCRVTYPRSRYSAICQIDVDRLNERITLRSAIELLNSPHP